MKARYLIATAAIAATALAACSNEEVNVLPDNNAIRVSTEVSSASSRAGMTTDNLDLFGMYINPTEASNTYSYNNYCWKKSAGTWSCYSLYTNNEQDAATPLWKSDSSPVTVTAYYPYNSSYGNIGDEEPVSFTNDITKDDHLYAQAVVTPKSPDTAQPIFYDSDLKALKVSLKHRFAKLYIKLTFATEYNDPSNGNATVTNPLYGDKDYIKIKGLYQSAKWNLSTNALTQLQNTSQFGISTTYENAAGTSSDASALKSGVATAELIVLPQTISKGGLSIMFDIHQENVNYIWTSNADITFEEGKVYTLPLTVGKDMVTAGTWSVSDWTAGNGTTGENKETD